MILRWLTPCYVPIEVLQVVSVNIIIYWWSLCPVTTDLIMRVNVRTTTTTTTTTTTITTTAAHEARNLKTAYQVLYIVDHYYSFDRCCVID